ncbi:MAG: cation:proton antiporter [Candidatus Eisenbacteria sp.]|nr:cation:proton antiporter [Candidatus Eisenbacteria bacterium]
MEIWTFLLELTGLLALAALLGTISERLGFSALIGYLLAGLLLGPGGFGLVETANVAPVAELGVALLLFSIGLEFSLPRLRRLGPTVLWGGLLQVLVTGTVFSVLALALGWSLRPAIVIGAVICLSSTASVLRLLRDRTELETVPGRSALGILLVQDIAVVPLVLLVTLLGGQGGLEELLLDIVLALAAGLGLIGVLLLAGRFVLPRFLTQVVLTRNRELAILWAVVICLGTTWVAHEIGLSPALGALVAGLVLAESPFATQIRADVGALRALFVALFFAGVGMLAELAWFTRHAAILPGVLLGVLAVKAIIIAAILRFLRLPLRHAIAAGLALCQIGEFGFVLLQVAGGYGLLPAQVMEVLLLATVGALLATPFLLPLGYRLGALLDRAPLASRQPGGAERSETAPGEAPALRDHVLVVGYGPAGQQVAERLHHDQVPVCIIDANPRAAELTRQRGLPVLIGDATFREILDHAGLKSAQALVVTVPDHGSAQSILRLSRATAPHVPVIVRARYHRFARDLADDGAAAVYDEEGSAGESMARLVADCLRTCPRTKA